jgi:hypothetical protein
MIQSHFHLSSELEESGEQAPTLKWRSLSATKTPTIVMSMKMSLRGYMMPYVLRDENGKVGMDQWDLEVIVMDEQGMTLEQRVEALENLQGEIAYYVPHEHPPDGNNHAAYVRTVFVEEIGTFEPLTRIHNRFHVQVRLREGKTLEE